MSLENGDVKVGKKSNFLEGMSKGFQEGEWEFEFPNGDKYNGHYCAHVSGLAWRQGPGVYTTHDGQVYEGDWKDDKLNEAENVRITFSDRDQYFGKIHKYKYNGPGTYCFKNRSSLTSEFLNNKPGEVIYIDHFGFLWWGKSMNEHVILTKEHIFSSELDMERGKGHLKHRFSKELESVEDSREEIMFDKQPFNMKEWEEIVFSKSFKSPTNIDFEDSDWFREYQDSNEMHNTIFNKVNRQGTSSLNDNEKNWYKQYLKSLRILKKRKEKEQTEIHSTLLRKHFSEIMHNPCPPVKVFYPTPHEECAFEG